MTVKTFRTLLKAEPFRPFRIVMSSGKSYEIRHPEMAWLTQSDLLVGTGREKNGVPGEFQICSLLHITAVEAID